MIIQFSNWQLINLNALNTGITSALTEFDNLLNPFDSFAIMPPGVETNTQITGTWFNSFIGTSFNVDLRGNHFLDEVPIETVTSLSLIEANSAGFNRNLLVTGSVTYNYDNGLYSGSLKKLSYTSTNIAGLTNLLIEGTFNVDPIFGEFIGGTATKYNITFNGNTLNMAGSIKLNAADDIIGGTISSFTFTDNLGHNFATSGLTLNALDFYNITDPLSHADLSGLFALVNDPTRLAGNDTITGGDTSDTIYGFAGNDALNGLAGTDTLIGGLGSDTLDGGTDADSMDGGDGNDTYIVDDTGDTVTESNAVTATGGTDTVKSILTSYTLTTNVENLTLTDGTATGGTAPINGTGNELNNIIIGNAGDNILLGGAGKDTLTGNAGNDTLDGESDADTLNGGAGDDTYFVDLIETGTTPATTKLILQDSITDTTGIDTLKLRGAFTHNFTYPISTITLASTLENLDASLVTGAGWLNLTGNTLSNNITGTNDGGVLSGLAGDDSLLGGTGSDVLFGGLGTDTLKGGAGNDTYDISDTLDIINEEGNTDIGDMVVYRVNASTTATSTLTVGTNINTINLTATTTTNLNLTDIENLIIVGTGKYNLVGNAQQNQLIGNAANNVIDGGDGDDILDGGAGLDTLIGGAGDDFYAVDSLAEATLIEQSESDSNNTLAIGFNYVLTNTSKFNNIYLLGTGAINATGNDNNNTIYGNNAANILNGGAGADSMDGGNGNDTYFVDNTGDVVRETNSLAAGGIDTVQSTIDFDLSNNSNFDIRDNIEKLTLTSVAISGIGNALANTLIGNAEANTLDGNAGNDTLLGGDGADTLTGGAGVDALTGGKGNDTYNIDLVRANTLATSAISLQDTVSELANAVGSMVEGIDTIILTNLTGNAGAPTDFSNITNATTLTVNANVENFDAGQTASIKLNITGNALANTITGNNADNILLDSAGDDTLNGGAGNDTLDGGLGADALYGGTGNDTYLVDIVATTTGVAPAPIVITGARLQDSVIELAGTIGGIDTLKLRGSVVIPIAAGATNITLTNELTGIENLDISLTGTTKLDLTGNDDDNALTGNAANNVISGGLGNDTLDGGAGADTMNGGDGDDIYIVENALDSISEAVLNGNDLVRSSVSYTLSDNVENLTLTGVAAINATGSSGSNTLTGNTAANILNGGGGADTMLGGAGNDTYILDQFNDVVIEGLNSGIDLVQVNITDFVGNYTLTDNVENATLTNTTDYELTGNALNNVLTGNAGANRLSGGAGNDTLLGGDGGDDLTGNAGVDALTGGKGNDTYNIDLIRTSALPTSTIALQDTVNELAGMVEGDNDTIILTNLTGNAGAPTDFSNITNATTLTVNANIETFDAIGTGNLKLNITGNALDNTILGNNADNIIDGGTGNDFLRAYDGNDSLLGGAGDDLLDGDSGNDTLDGGAGVDELRGDQGDDTYIVDIIASGTGVNTTAVLQDKIVADFAGVNTLKLRGAVATTNSSTIDLGTVIQRLPSDPDQTPAPMHNADISLTGTTKLNIIGNALDNNIIGNAANNVISGNFGNDTINGAAGNDTLSGGEGNDSLDGGIGTDTMDGGEGNDTYVLDVIADSIINETGTSGTDTAKVAFTANLSNAKFNNIENLILAGAAVNGTGNVLENDITGNDGANTLDGGFDNVNDTLRGGKGNDIYILRAGDTVIENTNEGTDLIRSSFSYDLLLANNVENLTLLNASSVPNDSLNNINAFGNDLANTLTGNDGDNAFIGAAGADTLIGGKGNDRYNVNLKLSGVEGANTAAVSLEDTIIETTAITDGLEDALTLVGSYNLTKATTITLAAGLEYLLAENTGSTLLNLTGNSANNIIQGNDAANIIDGAAGTDTLTGFKGDDTYIVDIVNDALKFNLQDAIFEEFGTLGSSDGKDTLRLRGSLVIPAAAPALTYDLNVIGNGNLENIDASLTGTTRINLTGNAENNILTGNAANNVLTGGDGDDILVGGAGSDTMSGGDGNDDYFVDNVLDTITETQIGGDEDTVHSTASYTLTNNLESLFLEGTAAINGTGNDDGNIISGNNAANLLSGGAGDDSLYGNGGADTLDGGTGADFMVGGDGNDIYVVDDALDKIYELNVNTAVGGVDLVRSSVDFDLSINSGQNFRINVENLTLTGTNNINGTGNALNNTITGNAGTNTLDGGAGVDILNGGLESDKYIVDLVQTGTTAATFRVALQDAVTEALNAGTNDILELRGNFNHLNATLLTLDANLETLDASQTGSTKLNITGNVLANTITGNNADNILLDSTGNDILNGGAGNDTLDGGIGVDTLVGGTGDDTYLVDIIATTTGVAPAPIIITGVTLQDNIFEDNGTTDGIDTLKLRGSVVIPAATQATNIALTSSLASIENLDVSLTGTTRLDLTGNAENNILTGNAANNIIDGGLGNDILTGGAGNDIFVFDATGTSNFDVITDFVSGIDNIRLDGSRFDILFNAGFYEERLLIGTGNNVTAQEAYHYLVYNKTTGELWFNRDANGTIDIDGNGIDAPELIAKFTPNTTLQWTDILNITLRGTSANDVLRGGRGNDNILEPYFGNDISGNDSAYGGDGNDFIQLGSGSDYIEGGAGNDIIYAGIELAQYSPSWPIQPDNDTVYGGDGNDSIYGGINGTDILDGGNGDDYLTGGSYATATLNIQNKLTLIGGAGNDTLIGGYGNDTLNGGAGNDSLEGGEGNDVIDGGTGDDIIRGNSNSTLLGGDGNDTLYGRGNGGAGDDTYHLNNYSLIVDTSGIDTVISYDSFTTLYTLGSAIENLIIRNANNITATGNSSNNIITTEASGNATLSGEGGNDKLTGYLGNDTINGGAGNDTITGSRGADILTGGLGADRFEYHAQEDSMFTFASDTITDFSQVQLDKIDFSIFDADATTVGINDAFTFIGNNVAFSNIAGQLRFDSTNNTVYGDIDGNSTADIQITLTGVTNLMAGDFIL